MNRSITNSKFPVILLVLGLGFFISSCSCDIDCATFDNFSMCDADPSITGCTDNQIAFPQDADFLTASVEITHGEPNDILTFKMFFKENGSFAEFASQNKALKDFDDEFDGTERKIRVSSGLRRNVDKEWPVGEYKVEIELSQEEIPLNATQNFRVE